MRASFFIAIFILLIPVITESRADKDTPSGISFHVLRVIYPEAENMGVILKVYNTTPNAYLMQSRVRPVDATTSNVDFNWQGQPTMPFIITPPLSRLDGHGEVVLRIRRNDMPLPTDRESVFYISMTAMPAQQLRPVQGKIVMTIMSNLKLFYRPEGLSKRAVEDMAPKLRFIKENNHLVAINPTPYWLTFSHLAQGEFEVDSSRLRLMVPPFGRQAYPIQPSAEGYVTWQLIDEDGWNTPVTSQAL